MGHTVRPPALLATALAAGLALSSCTGRTTEDATHDSGSHEASSGPADFAGTGVTRTYNISADEVGWDYAPAGRNQVTGKPFGEQENVFVAKRPDRIGSRYLKCLYRGYADAGFHTLQHRPASEAYLGNLGPTIRAEVGDTITVHFRNTCRFPTSMHPHGVRYAKASEGSTYADGSGTTTTGGAVPTDRTFTYTWEAVQRSGPGPMDGPSAVWMYHSHVDEVADVYAGLTGFLVVTARGKAKADGSPAGIDREVFSLFEVDDENSSPLLDANVARLARKPAPDDDAFVESNLMHSVNGYVYGNGPVPTMAKGERVRWYLMGMGTEVDLHTPHWHGNTATINGMRTDVANLLPASMLVADLTPDAVGTWLFHCHVADHITAGMLARYQVTD